MKKLLLVPVLVALSLAGCKKESSAPKIVINEPKKSKYKVAETMPINVTATDEKEMHEVKVWLITRPQNDTLYYQKKHSHSKSVTLDGSYVIPTLPDDQKADFLVLAENEDGKTATAKHSIEVHDH